MKTKNTTILSYTFFSSCAPISSLQSSLKDSPSSLLFSLKPTTHAFAPTTPQNRWDQDHQWLPSCQTPRSNKAPSSPPLVHQHPLTQLTPLFLLEISSLGFQDQILQIFFLLPWPFLLSFPCCFFFISMTSIGYSAQSLSLFSLCTLTLTVISFSTHTLTEW